MTGGRGQGPASAPGRGRPTRRIPTTAVLALVLALAGPGRAAPGDPGDGTAGILGEIAQYDAQLAELDKADVATKSREADIRATLAARQADQATAAAEVERRRASIVMGLRAAYRLQRRGFARLLFDAQSPDELRRRVHYLLDTVQAQQSALHAFRTSVDTRTAAAAAAAAEMQSLAALQAEREKQRTALQEERAHRVALLRSVRGTPTLAGQYGAERAQAAAAFNATASQPATPVIAIDHSDGSGADGFRNARGSLPWPVRGRVVTGWGPYTDPTTQETVQNMGLDIAAAPGTPFRAVFAGTVTRSGYVRGYGQVVMVQHGTYATVYAHANGLRVAQGQDVKAGDVLGLVGSTGLLDESEARLHFEIRYNGTPQNPAEWLGG